MNRRELEQRVGYTFKDIYLLQTALTHCSCTNERGVANNQRLEFLGDAVLGFCIAAYIYKQHPQMSEGEMTRLRAALVCEERLHQVAKKLNLGEYMEFGVGEEMSGGRTRPSVLADCVEAVIAAIYLDGGIQPATEFINKYVPRNAPVGSTAAKDSKTALQEYMQKFGVALPRYEIVNSEGPDNSKTFFARVTLPNGSQYDGSGTSKQRAQQAAAHAALTEIGLLHE